MPAQEGIDRLTAPTGPLHRLHPHHPLTAGHIDAVGAGGSAVAGRKPPQWLSKCSMAAW